MYFCPPASRNIILSVCTSFFFSSRRRHTRLVSDWSSDVCSSDLNVRSIDAKAAETAAQRQALLDGLELEVSQALTAEHDGEFAVNVSQQALASAEEEIGRASCRERVEVAGVAV